MKKMSEEITNSKTQCPDCEGYLFYVMIVVDMIYIKCVNSENEECDAQWRVINQ